MKQAECSADHPTPSPSYPHTLSPPLPPLDAEWLQPDGLGGFASGTVSGIRTRRYHALLLVARTPPTGRVVLVNGIEAWVETPAGTFALSSQRYAPDVIHPDGASRIVQFEQDPFPRWRYRLDDGTEIHFEIAVCHRIPAVTLLWTPGDACGSATLYVRPLVSGRDYHHLQRENPQIQFDAKRDGDFIRWKPYPDLPEITAYASGEYIHEPQWYRNFEYSAERERGLDYREDLASPGVFRLPLHNPVGAAIVFASGCDLGSLTREVPFDIPSGFDPDTVLPEPYSWAIYEEYRERQRRWLFRTPLDAAADAYIVPRGTGKTIIAGYPWFTDWGRDTFIAIRGLCLASGRLDDARDILLAWAGAVSEGMLPNRFPDSGDTPEYNSVDASLWYVIAVHEFLEAVAARARIPEPGASRSPLSSPGATAGAGSTRQEAESQLRATECPVGTGGSPTSDFFPRSDAAGVSTGGVPPVPTVVDEADEQRLRAAVSAILEGYARGTRYGIRLDDDGLVAAGEHGHQLTWMDAKVDGRVITPRIGKPVEIQALWLNALRGAADFETRWRTVFEKGLESFGRRFWNAERGCLYDVVDVDHVPGAADGLFRPNQIFAVGGLPFPLLTGERARQVVDAVEERLWTPLGLRSLAPGEPGYCGSYCGDGAARDGAYHQGTVWAWLAGPFVEAWVRVRGNTPEAKREARGRFLASLLAHLDDAGLGHISEIADAEPPFTPRGCPFQAWSVGEALRLDRVVLAEGVETFPLPR